MKKRISFQTKIFLCIVVMSLILSGVLLGISYMSYSRSTDEHYERLGEQVARTASLFLEEDYVRELVAQLGGDGSIAKTQEYARVLGTLRDIRDANNALYLYVVHPAAEGAYFLLDTDDSEDGCPYGYFMDYYEGSFDQIVDELLRGDELPAIISDEEYGHIISFIYPYRAGEGLAYVCVDISMEDVIQDQYAYLFLSTAIITALTLVFVFLFLAFASRAVVRPIRLMSCAAREFVVSGGDGYFSDSISRLDIHSHDELEDLSSSMRQMERDIVRYVTNLRFVTAEKERIGAELDVAKHIQASMLPCIFPPFPDRPEIDIYATMDPAKEVGGDFYDFFLTDHDHLAMVIADVSGKGVPAALFMVIAKTMLKNCAQTGLSPKAVLEQVNNQLCENNEAEMFVTVWLGILQLSTGKLVCANAGHEYPALKRANGDFELFKDKHGFVLAGMEGSRYSEYELQLSYGDKLFVYTDGVTEATNAENELYGLERMVSALNAGKDGSPAQILPAVREDINAFVGEAPQFDDITMLCLEYKQRPDAVPESGH